MEKINKISEFDRIHPYPAKFTIEMISDYIERYSEKGDIILDPFCGSGTTLLASKILERKSIGFDINPIAFIISKVKSNDYSEYTLKDFTNALNDNMFKHYESIEFDIFKYDSIDHWFTQNAIYAFSYIKHLIHTINDDKIKDVAFLSFSSIINEFSNQESDTRYVAKKKNDVTTEVIFKKYLQRFFSFSKIVLDYKEYNFDSYVFLTDSNNILNYVPTKSVKMILTSPPYPNTYDYYLYHKHRMTWLGYDYKPVMLSEIGSRREFSSLKKNHAKFTDDIKKILEKCYETLVPNGIIVMIIGDGKIAGERYDSFHYISIIANELNLKIIDYKKVNLDETSKSFSKSFRTKGKIEHFIVLEKGV